LRGDKLKLGWFSSARDKAARDLLLEVYRRTKDGFIKAELGFIFLTKEKGESKEGDEFYALCEALGLKVMGFSSRRFLPELRQRDPATWRKLYHQEVKRLIEGEDIDLGVLSGYMLVVDKLFLKEYALINLHPALPGGPQGSWEEVIWAIIEKRQKETGAMVHLVTEELDRGPALSFFTIHLEGEVFDPLWEGIGGCPNEDLRSYEKAQELFWTIRKEEEKREPPLLVLTLRALSLGEMDVDKIGSLPPRDFTEEVEAYLRGKM